MGTSKPGPSPGPLPKKRRKFTRDEEDVIEEYFQVNIESHAAPRMSEVTDFLRDHQLQGRSAKDIYNKVWNLYK